MDLRQPMINTIRQTNTELSDNFFSLQNMEYIQSQARDTIRTETGMTIDAQSYDDLGAIMRRFYITNMADPYNNVVAQITDMNAKVLTFVTNQIRVGLAERVSYLQKITTAYEPLDRPVSTTQYGNKMPINDKIGL